MQIPPRPVALKPQRAHDPLARRRLVGALVPQQHRPAPALGRPQPVEQLGQGRRPGRGRLAVSRARPGVRGRLPAPGRQGGDRRIGGGGEGGRQPCAQPGQQRGRWAVGRVGRRLGAVEGRGEQEGRALARRQLRGRRRLGGWRRRHLPPVAGQGPGQGRLAPRGDHGHAWRELGAHGAPRRAAAQRGRQVRGLVAQQHGLGAHAQAAAGRQHGGELGRRPGSCPGPLAGATEARLSA